MCCFVNDGSAGKPKDGDPRACYAVIDVIKGSVDVTFRRVTYDVAAVASAIRASELPDQFADALEQAA
jgi:diadenosine tetraphosphatase ApaH/serine/threonine PP2A family protein phosphatase